jgi:hypothetical protein
MPAPRKARAPRKPRAAAGPRPPAAPFDAPLETLERDALSAFVYAALVPDETAALVKKLGLSLPGFRRESLGEVQRADLLADEVRANPPVREEILGVLRAAYRDPPLAATPLAEQAAAELAALLDHEDAVPLTVWRLLCDPDPAVVAVGRRYLSDLARDWYGRRDDEGGRPRQEKRASPEERAAELERRLADAVARADALKKDGEARLEAARRKAEEQREKLQEWLREARARESAAHDEAARAREAAEASRREQERLEAALRAARAEDAAQELARRRAEARDLEGRVTALESRLERAQQREQDLTAELERARAAGPAPAPPAHGGDSPGDEIEDAPASWLLPVYTQEFYDSLAGWDRRIQRAAFKQAALLAQDHRHPSLRAIPLEGVPGYYRVRVATDVRLLYRRGERQNTIEILSLIDREDLDRYVKQAKTR